MFQMAILQPESIYDLPTREKCVELVQRHIPNLVRALRGYPFKLWALIFSSTPQSKAIDAETVASILSHLNES